MGMRLSFLHIAAKPLGSKRGALVLGVVYPHFAKWAAIIICVAFLVAAAQASDDEQLERFLIRLGLSDLQIVHLESALERPTLAASDRQQLAQRLADLYAEQLMSSTKDDARYSDLMQRIESLRLRFPQANTPALQVMLLQADYNRAEAQIARWIADRSEKTALEESRELLQAIAPRLDDHQRHLRSQIEALYAEVEGLPASHPQVATKEREAQRLQTVLGRASYFAGWANYYLGLTKAPSGAAEYSRSRDIFRQLLGIEDEDYASIDPEWLSLGVIWRSRAVIGLGLAEAALGDIAASRAVFQWLDHRDVPLEIKDQAHYWYVQGLINADRLDDVRQYTSEQIKAFTGAPTQGKVSLCVALVRAGFGKAGVSSSNESEELAMLGIAGLAKLGQYNAVQQLLDKYEIPLENKEGFFLRWMHGRRLFSAAQQTKNPEDYRAAAKALAVALDEEEAAGQAIAAGHCRYELGWCHYRAGDYEAAAQAFELAITPLKAAGTQEGANAAWMAFVSYRQLAAEQPRYVASALEMLQRIQRDFPNHEYAKKANYHAAQLQRSAGSLQDSIRNLRKIPRSDPQFLAARYELCSLLYQQWSESKNASEKAAALEELKTATEEFLSAAGARGDKERQVRVLSLVAAAALGSEPSNPSLAAEFLTRAESLADGLPDTSSAKTEFHYRALQLARRQQDDPARKAHAQWIADHAAGSIYETSALVELARELEQRFGSTSDDQRAVLQEEAYQLYSRLVQRWGDSPTVLRSNKNARVALERLAEQAYATGRYAEAAQRIQPLLTIDPKNQAFLRLAGLANFESGQFESALPHWRILAFGLPRGSEKWFEARFYHVASLAEVDREQAKQTLKQIQLLYPEYGGPPWQKKFEALAQRLK